MGAAKETNTDGMFLAISDDAPGFENKAFKIQEDYMAQLEESYQGTKVVKIAKKLRIHNCAAKIQRAFRRSLHGKRTSAIVVI